MFGIEYGLGRFGDRRLQKGGPSCTRALLNDRARAFEGSAERAQGRCE